MLAIHPFKIRNSVKCYLSRERSHSVAMNVSYQNTSNCTWNTLQVASYFSVVHAAPHKEAYTRVHYMS